VTENRCGSTLALPSADRFRSRHSRIPGGDPDWAAVSISNEHNCPDLGQKGHEVPSEVNRFRLGTVFAVFSRVQPSKCTIDDPYEAANPFIVLGNPLHR